MRRIKLWIEPALNLEFGAAIAWSWRNIFTSLGLAWEQVESYKESDIVYATAGCTPCPEHKLKILCSPELWKNSGRLELQGVETNSDWKLPLYRSAPLQLEKKSLFSHRCLARDIVFDVFWLATDLSEYQWRKNTHGHLELNEKMDAIRPFYAKALGSELILKMEEVFQSSFFIQPVPRWPGNKRMAVCASHDVDYPEVIRWLEPFRILKKDGLKSLKKSLLVLTGKRTHWHFDGWLAAEKLLGVRSAFYFVPRKGSLFDYITGTPDPFYDIEKTKFRVVFEKLKEEGFEIGLHASYHAFESEEHFIREKEKLELLSNQKVDGCRHHYWHLNPKSPEATLKIHEKIGLKYDCSLTHERYIGWRRCISWPFFPFSVGENKQIGTLQMPTSWMDDHLFRHKKDNPGDQKKLLEDLVRTVSRQQGMLLVDIHDYVFDEVLFPGWASIYLGLFSNLAHRSDIWFATPGEVARYWRVRYHSIEKSSLGLNEGPRCLSEGAG